MFFRGIETKIQKIENIIRISNNERIGPTQSSDTQLLPIHVKRRDRWALFRVPV